MGNGEELVNQRQEDYLEMVAEQLAENRKECSCGSNEDLIEMDYLGSNRFVCRECAEKGADKERENGI